MSEANDLAGHVIFMLNGHGWNVWRNNSGQIKKGNYIIQLSPPGKGDVIGHDPRGNYVHIEIKIDDDVISDVQAEEMYRVSTTKHGIVGVITSEKQFHEWFDTCLRIG